MRREIDKLVKDKVEKYSIEYDPSHWQAMELLLDKERNHHRIGWVYWMILAFIILSLGMFVGMDLFDKNPTADDRQVIAAREYTAPSIELIPVNNLHLSADRTENDEQRAPKKEGYLQFQVNRQLESKELTTLPNSPIHNSIIGQTQFEKMSIDGDEEGQVALLGNNSGINPLANSSSESFEGIMYEKPWKKLWTLGIGWQVENSWGWSTGAFASLGLRLHESISIRFRPGFTLRSDNSLPSESYKQVEYDFGRTDIEGEINKLESYAVDVPLSVQLHKQRHILALGGGVHYAFMQRVSITERQLSNFSNFTNSRTPFFENVDQRKAWVQPDESLYPFAELYYSYLLTPSFELGGRSRFYIPEDMNLSNRLNFAAQLVWYIN